MGGGRNKEKEKKGRTEEGEGGREGGEPEASERGNARFRVTGDGRAFAFRPWLI